MKSAARCMPNNGLRSIGKCRVRLSTYSVPRARFSAKASGPRPVFFDDSLHAKCNFQTEHLLQKGVNRRRGNPAYWHTILKTFKSKMPGVIQCRQIVFLAGHELLGPATPTNIHLKVGGGSTQTRVETEATVLKITSSGCSGNC